MKKTTLLLFAAGMLLLSACNKQSEAPSLNAPDSVSFASEGETKTIEVSSTVEWTLSTATEWLKVSPKHGSGTTTVTVQAEKNVTGAVRKGSIDITAGSLKKSVSVEQASFAAAIIVSAPQSIAVEKGKQLKVDVTSNTADWAYALTDGNWLTEAAKDEKSITFDLNPAVAFDPAVAAVLTFTTPSDPSFTLPFSIKPENWFTFTCEAPESIEVKKGAQLVLNIATNLSDDQWTCTVTQGPWLSQVSKGDGKLVFDLDPAKLLDPEIKATIAFSSKDYANLSTSVQIQPLSYAPATYMVDKSAMRAFVQENDGIIPNDPHVKSEYLFDGIWKTHYEDYSTSNIAGVDMDYNNFQLLTQVEDAAAGHGDSFTIDAGEAVSLAKIVVHHYYDYTRNDPIEYEIYAYTGSGEYSSNWNDWTKIAEFNGLDNFYNLIGFESGEYCPILADGDTLPVEEGAPKARYYRFLMKSNGYAIGQADLAEWWYVRTHWCSLSEMTFYAYE